jgi:predicted DNA-binding WGR domain protein/uncharacterized protein YwqG
MTATTRLVFDEGRSVRFWAAALDGKKLTVRWGRGGAEGQEKARTWASPQAAKKELDALVAARKEGGWVDADPPVGEPVFLAEKHEHEDLVLLTEHGEIACALCQHEVPMVRVGPAPAPPRRGERSLEAFALQRRVLWPLAARVGAGKRLPTPKLLALLAQALRRDKGFAPTAKRLDATRAKALRMSVAPAKGRIARLVDKVGGDPVWLGAEQWPTCSGCDKPMMFLVQLRTGPGTGVPLLRKGMLYVFQCQSDPGMCEDWSATSGANAVVVQPNKGRAAPIDPAKKKKRTQYEKAKRAAEKAEGRAPADLYCTNMDSELAITLTPMQELMFPDAELFPDPVERTAARALYEAWEHGARVGRSYASKLGGYPVWVQDDETPRCSQCKKPMRFVAQIDSQMHRAVDRELVFGDSGSSYLFVCREHRQGSWLWQCF